MSYRDKYSLFKECQICSAKPGSPVLCDSCLHNRSIIEKFLKIEEANIVENKVKPIKPEDIVAEKIKFIPDEVFSSFNTLIARNWNGSSSTFKQDDVVELIINSIKLDVDEEHMKTFRKTYRRRIYDEHMLDIEDIYRSQGWKVYYDKPAYNETYAATFCFSKK